MSVPPNREADVHRRVNYSSHDEFPSDCESTVDTKFGLVNVGEPHESSKQNHMHYIATTTHLMGFGPVIRAFEYFYMQIPPTRSDVLKVWHMTHWYGSCENNWGCEKRTHAMG